jgi:hypothetical protein
LLTPISNAILNHIHKERCGDQTDVDNAVIARVVEAFIYLSSDKIAQEGVKPLDELE